MKALWRRGELAWPGVPHQQQEEENNRGQRGAAEVGRGGGEVKPKG